MPLPRLTRLSGHLRPSGVFLRHHRRTRAIWEKSLRGPALGVRKQFESTAGAGDDYERFVATSPFFLGTRDVEKTQRGAADALLDLYVQSTCDNAAVLLLRKGLPLMCTTSELFAVLRYLDAEEADDPDGWQTLLTNTLDQWAFPGSSGSDPKPIFGWAVVESGVVSRKEGAW